MLGHCLLPGLWLWFPEVPPEGPFLEGCRMAREGRSLDSVFAREVRPLSTHFDGHRRRRVEACVMLDADLAARWLGWLSAREALTADQAAERWNAICASTEGQVWFFAQLGSFPTASTLELTRSRPAVPDKMRHGVWQIRGTGFVTQGVGELLGEWRSRDRIEFNRFAWWRTPGLKDLLAPKLDAGYEAPRFPLGDYTVNWQWVRAWLPAEALLASEIQLVYTGSRRERRARFAPTGLHSPEPKVTQ